MRLQLKFAVTIALVLVMIGSLTGCSNVNYHAKLYDNIDEQLKEEFKKDNVVELSSDGEYPTKRFFMIDTQEKYDELFGADNHDIEVDFASQMLVVYTFKDIYRRRNELTKVYTDDHTLFIKVKMEKKSGIGDATSPYQHWLGVVLDKMAIDHVEFVSE